MVSNTGKVVPDQRYITLNYISLLIVVVLAYRILIAVNKKNRTWQYLRSNFCGNTVNGLPGKKMFYR